MIQQIVDLKARGVLTLPKAVRDQAGLKEGDRFLIEVSTNGILLKPVGIYPVEMYSQERVDEFLKAAEEVEGVRFQ